MYTGNELGKPVNFKRKAVSKHRSEAGEVAGSGSGFPFEVSR